MNEGGPAGTPGTLWTYRADADGNPTTGGYSQGFTVSEEFACAIPDQIPFDAAAPLLCAGITMYSPLRRYGAGPGTRVAIVGMGGLGHVGVKLAAAMDAEVSVISHGRSKEADARRFGASAFHATSEEGTVEALRGSFDLIICTVSANNLDYEGLMGTLRPYGVFVDVGLPEEPVRLPLRAFVNGAKSFAGSQIGGIRETQEMLDFCAAHGVAPQVEIIGGEDITATLTEAAGTHAKIGGLQVTTKDQWRDVENPTDVPHHRRLGRTGARALPRCRSPVVAVGRGVRVRIRERGSAGRLVDALLPRRRLGRPRRGRPPPRPRQHRNLPRHAQPHVRGYGVRARRPCEYPRGVGVAPRSMFRHPDRPCADPR